MRKILLGLALTSITAGTLLTSCQSKEQKVEDAKENVQDAKKDLNNAQNELNAEYPAYRTDAEKRIADNEERIADLKRKINTGGKPLDNARARKIQELEDRNAELRSRLYGYEKAHTDWESFKRDFNKSMDELGNSIRDTK